MPGPKPPSPSIADAIAALNTQISVDIPGLPTNPMTDLAAQNIANQMQRDRAQALAEAAGATRAAIDPTSPENPPSEC